jgi:hypothetical protein
MTGVIGADISPAAAADHPEALVCDSADTMTTGVDVARAAGTYQTWGWPVTFHRDRDQVSLDLRSEMIGLIIPTLVATEITATLSAWRSTPSVVVHPCAPTHRMLVCSEPFPVALPWPPGIIRVTPPLLLPPTLTPRGPLTWGTPPQPDVLRLCREIDAFGALRATVSDLVSPPR